MEKECCNVNVTETEDGLRIEIRGEALKEKAATLLKNCCGEDVGRKGLSFCCGSGK